MPGLFAILAAATVGLCAAGPPVQLIGKTRYLNDSRAVVTHTMDDSEALVLRAVDAVDKYGIKATFFISTARGPLDRLWPRMRMAIANGHEVGSHSRSHTCKWPGNAAFCETAYSDAEVSGSRDDILKNTEQPWVWAWAYPCGLCAGDAGIRSKLKAAGYLVARNYPDEPNDGHVVPNLQTWAADPYNAAYTQVVQQIGGIAKRGNSDVAALNAKFDEVYSGGGIYSFLSHSQWLEFGPEGFYERHMKYIGGRKDIWYVPTGPLYAYKTLVDATEIVALEPAGSMARYRLSNHLDPKIYRGSITVAFTAPAEVSVLAGGVQLNERADSITDRWDDQYIRRNAGTVNVTVRPNTILEFRQEH